MLKINKFYALIIFENGIDFNFLKIIINYYAKQVLIHKFAFLKTGLPPELESNENFNTSILCPKTLRLEKVLI